MLALVLLYLLIYITGTNWYTGTFYNTFSYYI